VPSSPSPTDRIVSVAVPVPGLGLLSYRYDGPHPPASGARVRVPLGTRTVVGCVVNPSVPPTTAAERRGLKAIVELLDQEPFLPAVVVELAVWVGDYYASGPGEALAMAMPPLARRGASGFRTIARVTLAEDVDDAQVAVVRGGRQRDALARLRAAAGGLDLADLTRSGITTATVRSLARRGLVRLDTRTEDRDPLAGEVAGRGSAWAVARPDAPDLTLTDEQSAALARLAGWALEGRFRSVLLHGVTGSGKTEVYLRLTDEVLRAGRRVLILVPEIALTPAVAGTFRARFGPRLAIQHSGLSDGERHDQWHRIRAGRVDVVVGTRSAVFAPLENVGLIVVDEEHDGSYKQDEAPRYHGRDVAVVRGRMERALVVLGSATPSLESAANGRSGRYETIQLTRRVLNRPLAAVRIVDMRPEYAAEGPDLTLSRPLQAALADRIDKGEQSLVLLNRRGFAVVVFCRRCGASIDCPHCSVSLTYYRANRRVRCHYCNYAARMPETCPTCGGEYLEQSGIGTERLEHDVRARFPGARVARVDRDTIRRRGAIAEVLRAVADGKIDILVGTQMIAKGHDFPAVTLVGVISADVGLGLADFRASERTFQLLTQVVGRAGRGTIPGEAIVQTLYPDHYSIRAAAAQDYEAFVAREMDFRSALMYPPAVALINVIVRGRTLEGALTDAADLVAGVRAHGSHGKVVGPAPAARARIRDEYRVQFFIKSRSRRAMRTALMAALADRPTLRRRVVVDVDPMSVL